MWDAHAQVWGKLSERWSERLGLIVEYVDVTEDPWWTERFAKSGPVARTGRIQPSLSRIVLTRTPGVPILAKVVSGAAQLRQELLYMLGHADDILGRGQVGRLTVVDAECAEKELILTFSSMDGQDMVTVLKGGLRQGKTLEQCGEWLPFRERDQVREAVLTLEGRKGKPYGLRVVEMMRAESRNPTSTWFATTAPVERVATVDVAALYLTRWPYIEDIFRRARNGGGLERSSGYGAYKTLNLAVVTKREKAALAQQRAEASLREALASQEKARRSVESARTHLEERKSAGEVLNRRTRVGLRQARLRLVEADRGVRRATREVAKAGTEVEKQNSTPIEIYARDTALDSIVTCLKMTLLCLLTFVGREFLGGYRITPRVFADALVTLPVTIRERQDEIVYEVAPNPRNPKMTALLAAALENVTSRNLIVRGRRLVARLRDDPPWT